MRWNKRFDGTRDSLRDRSHRPINPHPNAHTDKELKWINDMHRKNPHISICEMYGKLRSQKGYSRHPGSLYRIYKALGFSSKAPSTKKKRKPQKYYTPESLGIKWQMDVKYVPKACYVGEMPDKFYQYTMIDETSRERFIYPYLEQSSYSTIHFVKRAIAYFGYKPQIIQTDYVEFGIIQIKDLSIPLLLFAKRLRNATPFNFSPRKAILMIMHVVKVSFDI